MLMHKTSYLVSPSVWREWIEMPYAYAQNLLPCVSLRVEGVD